MYLYIRYIVDVLQKTFQGCLINPSHKCLKEDDLQMSYHKMSCRCLIGDNLHMSYQKVTCMRCLKDVLYNVTKICIVYL